MTTTQLNDAIRVRFMESVKELLSSLGEEILITASNEVTCPVVDAEGNDKFITLKFVIPKGSKDEPYDGYSVAESYKMHIDEMSQKKAEAKAKAEAKKARDAERRAKAKANKEKAKAE